MTSRVPTSFVELLYRLQYSFRHPKTYSLYKKYKNLGRCSLTQLVDHQTKETKKIISYAYENHEFYRNLYDAHNVAPKDFTDLSDLQKFPKVTKAMLRAGLAAGEFSIPENATWLSTSGSSGEPFPFPLDKLGARMRAACKLKTAEWYGKPMGTPWANVWREKNLSAAQKLTSRLLERKTSVSFYSGSMSDSNKLTGARLQTMIDQINNSHVRVVEGYVSALALIADYALSTKQRFESVEVVVTGAEYLSSKARRLIAKAFGAVVLNRYGGTEIGLMAHENLDGHLVAMSERLVFETKKITENQNLSEVIITDFTNKAMPFIRYAVGDEVADMALSDSEIFYGDVPEIVGRTNDFFPMPDGSLLTSHIWHVFFRDKPVKQFQVIQDSSYAILVRVVLEDNACLSQFQSDLERLAPQVKVTLEAVADIESGENGKFRHAYTEVNEYINSYSSEHISPARNVANMTAYSPVMDPEMGHQTLKLDWNESTVQPDVGLLDAIMNFVRQPNSLNWYPPTIKTDLKKKIGNYAGVSAANVEIFPGSDRAIDFVARIFVNDGDIVAIVEPTYDQARLTFELHGAVLKRITFRQLTDPKFAELERQLTGTERLVYLSNPNNPTGHEWPREQIERLLGRFPSVVFVVDEAYVEFSHNGSVCSLTEEYDNVFIVRTYSKGLGIAGLRLGYLIYPRVYESVVDKVLNVKDVNIISLVAGQWIMDNLPSVLCGVEKIKLGREYLSEQLRASGYDCVSGGGNFILLSIDKPKEFTKYLKEADVRVRDRSNYPGLGNYVRITCGTVEQMKIVMNLILAYEK